MIAFFFLNKDYLHVTSYFELFVLKYIDRIILAQLTRTRFIIESKQSTYPKPQDKNDFFGHISHEEATDT